MGRESEGGIRPSKNGKSEGGGGRGGGIGRGKEGVHRE